MPLVLASLRNNPFIKRLSIYTSILYSPLSWLNPRLLYVSPSPSTPFTRKFSAFIPICSKGREKHCLGLTLARFSTTSSETWIDEPTSISSSYFSVRVWCRKDVSDMLSEALICFGASSAGIDEPDSSENNDEICITSIFIECEDVGVCISNAADSIGLKVMPVYEVVKGEQYDWLKKTQESFIAVKVTDGLWIVPEWRTPPDVKATNIILNPGLAFGTGEHPTTKLCLLLLHSLIKGGEYFLDYGTGSGILGIAALKFGAALWVGFDVDPQAITSARQNAALNNIEPEKMQVCLVPSNCAPLSEDGKVNGDVEAARSLGMGFITERGKYDIVIANILLNPLIELADHIVSYAKPGGVIGVSGILSEQLPQIKERYSQYLEGISVSEMDGWACVTGTKKRRELKC